MEIDTASGTFALDGVAGYGRLVDGGDLGDSYNYSPPRQDSFVEEPESVTVRVDEQRARARREPASPPPTCGPITSTVPRRRRVGEHHVAVDTDVEVRADDAVVRVTTSFVNPSGDHRLRVHLPLPEPADHSHAESAFTVVTRGLTAEGRADEFGLPTAPANRFVTAGRLTVAHEGVCEYELIDIEGDAAKTIALTVLRSTGMLSRLGMAYRPFPAGPVTPVEGLQMRGKRVTLRYALASRLRGPVRASPTTCCSRSRPVLTLGGGSRAASGSELAVHGAEVSALHRVAGVLELRVFNPTGGGHRRLDPGTLGMAGRPARLPASSPSRAPSSYDPSGSPPPGCAATDSPPRLAVRTAAPRRRAAPRGRAGPRRTAPSARCADGRPPDPSRRPPGRAGRTTTAGPGPGP